MTETVLIIGASDKQDRYSYKAMNLLAEHGHMPVLMHPKLKEIKGTPVYNSLEAIVSEGLKIDTVTMYVNPSISAGLQKELVSLNPNRVIFNPGTENPELQKLLNDNQIATEDACTLVLLNTNQF
jgi:hypothetical protein